VKTDTAQLGGVRLILPELIDPIAYIESHGAAGGSGELPYWTRIWPASIVLASFMSAGKDSRSGRVLELGAGLGVPGLFAAARGRHVVLTDLEPDALEFARAAVELNHFEDRVEVRPLDWTAPSDDLDRFDTILGSEILYHQPLYPTIVELLTLLLAPDGRAYLAHEQRPFGIGFFRLAEERFLIRSTSSHVRDGTRDEPCKVFLHALQERRTRGTA
jgi:2-polyprenyl-3-methyl-5-hydroxy-6-metoxy-1,4-benzoquinol methylase